MLNRTQAPDFQSIQNVFVTKAQSKKLTNGIDLHWLNAGEQPVIRLEYLFRAGTWYEPQRGISYFTAKMLTEGTQRRSAAEIYEYIDQFGSFIEVNQNAERINLTVYTLDKHLPRLLPLLHEILLEPVFPEKELENLKTITRQNLQVNMQKTSFLAQHRFREIIFGEQHPYGKYIKDDDIPSITHEQLVAYHQHCIVGRPFDVVLSGQVTDQTLQLVDTHLAGFAITKDTISKPVIPIAAQTQRAELVEKPDSVQSSLRVGKRLLDGQGKPFTRQSAEYFQLSVLNEVLGGYFGSRLMKNIREDKGFTYGIHSSLGTFRHEGFLVIGTDVKKEFTSQTLDEIRKEMQKLQTEPVPEEELETVKNYLLGSFAGSVNTPFSLADHFKTIYFEGLDYSFFDAYVNAITQTTAESLRALAQTYLDVDSFTEVVVGGK
jgi:predicted Zn-dependent peptidase